MRDVLPKKVYDAIRNHLTDRANQAHEGWASGAEEEDTLTGDLGATLRKRSSIVEDTDGQTWEWRVTYMKFRGRGPGAAEKQIGADGIFEIQVRRNSETHIKGLLFQAKKVGRRDRRLTSQAEQMEALARGGSVVLEYGPDHYRAIPSERYLEEALIDDTRSRRSSEFPLLGDVLANEFLPCNTGIRGMYYDAVRQVLVLPGQPARRLALRHRVRVEASQLS